MNFDICWPPDRPPNDPRQAQDGSRRVLKAFFFDVEFCLRFWSISGSILSPFWPSKSIPKSIKNWLGAIHPHRILPRGPKTAPRCPKTSLGPPQEAFKTLLEPSWACLGSFLGRSWSQKSSKLIGLYTCFVNITIFEEDNAWKGILGWTSVD